MNVPRAVSQSSLLVLVQVIVTQGGGEIAGGVKQGIERVDVNR